MHTALVQGGGHSDAVGRLALHICQHQVDFEEPTNAEIANLYKTLVTHFNDDCYLNEKKERYIAIVPGNPTAKKIIQITDDWAKATRKVRDASGQVYFARFRFFPQDLYCLEDGIARCNGLVIKDDGSLVEEAT